MPVHNYRCKECETEFEVFYTGQAAVVREEPNEQCPKCDSKKKRRLVAKGTGFILKGPGWAKDGYGK